MERTMSVEDKIRRAEEIYNRKHEREYQGTTARVNVENGYRDNNQKVNKRLKKMIIQIVICMLIYLSFHYIVKSDYIFSKDFRSKCEEILAYDISFSEMYKNISNYIIGIQEKYLNGQHKNQEQTQEEQINVNEEQKENNNVTEEVQENKEEDGTIEGNQEEAGNAENVHGEASLEENIGGAVEEISEVEENGEAETLSEEDQMKKDAEEIKAKVSFIKPLTGVITSVFGWRNPKLSTVSKYHTGIDIAADQGTNIISATNGTVQTASTVGAYGNHLKIVIDDVTIIYAHCLSLEVKKGDSIAQGQVIAKVGSTGNSTGPHLHFEIRKDNRYVNPSLILDF